MVALDGTTLAETKGVAEDDFVQKKQSTSQKKFPEREARVAEAEKAMEAMDGDVLEELPEEQ